MSPKRIPSDQLPAHGQVIRSWLERRSLTLADLAGKLNPPITYQTLHRFMTTVYPRKATFERVAAAMEIPLEVLYETRPLKPKKKRKKKRRKKRKSRVDNSIYYR